MTVFVDTSGLFALLDEDDREHEVAIRLFESVALSDDLVTHNYVLVESMALVRRRLGGDAEARLVADLHPTLRVIWVDEGTHRAALAAYRLFPRAASFVDLVSFEIMRARGIEVAFAFDGDFEAEGFRRPSFPPEGSPRRLSEAPASYGVDEDADLVSVAELASRAHRSTNTIQSWRRRRDDFPTPVAELAAGPIWRWSDVEAWIRAEQPPRKPGAWRGRVHNAPDFDSPETNESIAGLFGV